MRLSRRLLRSTAAIGCLGAALLGLLAPTATSSTADPLPDSTRFYTPRPDRGAEAQIRQLKAAGQVEEAALLFRMVHQPQAVWLTGGTPDAMTDSVRQATERAERLNTVATLVIYNVPGRDCSQYSSGGAGSDAAYRSWVDGVAAGLPRRGRIVVVVEPDGLANLPSDCPQAYPGQDVAALTAGRIADIRYAATRIRAANEDALVYLDAGNSHWHSVGKMAERLDRAGVRDVQGFSLNVSNYHPTTQEIQYGSWIARCLHYAHNPTEGGWRLGHFDHCASQHHPATVDDPSTWPLTDAWYASNVDTAAGAPTGPEQLAHVVVDTSRNGRGPWTPGSSYPEPQVWCNPPGRGVGLRPTARTSSPLVDAYLWIKTPGQSDGQCNRGRTGSTTDPEWGGIVDPAAGAWFPQQALQLTRLAAPSLG